MRWWPIVVMLVACESASDFPGPPGEIDWTTLELAVFRGKVDGTEYQIDLPRGATEKVVGTMAVFDVASLSVKVSVYQEAQPMADVVPTLDQHVERDDGWSGTSSGTAYNYVYVDDGALLCTASTTSMPTAAQDARVSQICNSLRATSGLGNPYPYPAGLSPREVRAAMCQIAVHHARALEPAPKPSKKKKTKAQLADEAKAAAQLDADYAARQTRCERRRWTNEQINCITGTQRVAEASQCVPGW